MKNFKNKDRSHELECEKLWIFLTLMMVSGFYGTFTYTTRGGVFSNAQTANFLFLALNLSSGKILESLYYLIPISAYFLGAVISEAISGPIKKLNDIRWDTILIFIEIIVVLFLGLLPETAPYQISQIFISFICSMQYNTFQKTRKVPVATTFCTNHVRQTGTSFVNFIKSGDKQEAKDKLKIHLKMIGAFILGCFLATILCRIFLGKAILFTLIPLLIMFVRLLRDDISRY